MPKAKVDVLAEFAESLKTLTDAVKGIESRVSKLETPEPKAVEKPVSQTVNTSVSPFQKQIDNILNKNFTFRLEDSENPAMLNFVLLVPKKYSNASDSHWEFYHEDARPKAMSIREADIALKEHLERVLSNFSPDAKALIFNDR